ncbi:MAG: hypothetical protein IT186_24810 [Acidobacteria bacterium]|nr:hypothetical protein [Acidobacteriota bacterium]
MSERLEEYELLAAALETSGVRSDLGCPFSEQSSAIAAPGWVGLRT